MKIKIWLLITCLSLTKLSYGQNNSFQLTPFTGQNYLRLTIDGKFKSNPSNIFKLSISDKNGQLLYAAQINPKESLIGAVKSLVFSINNLKPKLWEPSNPVLYQISLKQFNKAGKLVSEVKERTGFRSFERKNGILFLNGKPIFLRGIAINPPGRGIPDELENSRAFALDYVRYMKSIHVNIIRIPDAEAWYDVCDELGMMVFGGNYSGKVAAGEKVKNTAKVGDETDGGFPSDYDKGVDWYENEKLGPIAHHPSLMVYAMTNETPFAGERALLWEKFLDYAFHKLKAWDETRVYIANAGYGYGKTGDITDIHRYWGWYYSSPFTFLHIKNEAEINPYPSKNQPITFTECVGNYTGPDGRYNLTPAHKNPSSQLAWTGHADDNIQSKLADEHQSFTFKRATETFRQYRSMNKNLSGVFPFTILFYNWDTIEKFDDINPKPVTNQVKKSYQPVLLSWENWMPNVYSNSTINPIVHIVNDADDFSDLKDAKMVFKLRDKAKTTLVTDSLALPTVPYYGTFHKAIKLSIPKNILTGDYELVSQIVKNKQVISENSTNFFIADENFSKSVIYQNNDLLLYDNSGKTKKALQKFHISFNNLTDFKNLSANKTLLIGENAANELLASNVSEIKQFIQNGGRILCLKQDSLHRINLNKILNNPLSNTNIDIDDPKYPVKAISPRNGYYLNPERENHPIFYGINRENLKFWNDYTNWDESKPGMPMLYPVTDGFTFSNYNDLKNTAILANYSSGLQAVAIAEQFTGKGSILLSGLDLVNRLDTDPIAGRMFQNMLNYMSETNGHEIYPLITEPIQWGNYETEKGIVTDLYSGFLVNATPRLPDTFTKGISVTKEGYQLAGGNRSGFNTRPGIQYVANGRRPFGPFAQSSGGQPIPEKGTEIGTASIYCSIPKEKNQVANLVWNPANEPVEITIKVNDLPELTKKISANTREIIDLPVNSSAVNITFKGDRRVVILETNFYKKN